jgi:hypothetical protein
MNAIKPRARPSALERLWPLLPSLSFDPRAIVPRSISIAAPEPGARDVEV